MHKVHRTKYGLALSTLAFVVAALTTGMSPYKTVKVTVNSRTLQTGTYASETVGQFLRQSGVTYTGYDLVEPARTTPVKDGMHIVVKRAKIIRFTNGMKRPIIVHTLASTVGTMLQGLHIRLSKQESLSVPLRATVRNGMAVALLQHRVRVVLRSMPIPYRTIRLASSSYVKGQDVVVTAGRVGKRKLVTRLMYVNDRLVAKKSTTSVVQQPVNEVIDVGTAPAAPVVASRSDASLVTSEVLTVVATAYANPGGITATGAPAGYGDIAVDPSVIPLGTKLYIPGYGYGVANDTGGAISGYRIDLCFDSTSQAIDFGRQVVQVYVLKNA